MQTVTQISEHPRKPGRYIAVVNLDAITETKTKIGVVIDDARAAQLREAGEVAATYDRALNLLAFRARSSRELSRRLKEKGASAECIEQVITKLRDAGLVDDAEFARQVARSKVSGGA